MVKDLTSFARQKNSLLNLVDRKITDSKTTNINEQFKYGTKEFKVDRNVLAEIMDSVETKFHNCEMIYHAYIENIDHGLLSGNPATLPFISDYTFTDDVATFKKTLECNDKAMYRDLIDINFQTFILMIASVYENLVYIIEIISKKVIVYIKNKAPLSTPLHDFRDHLKLLTDLGYRKPNELDSCLTSFSTYFDTYLSTITKLRNSFMHGFNKNLSSDGFNYRITNFDIQKIAAQSPKLNIDHFTGEVLNNTRVFIHTLYSALEKTIRHHTKKIPA